MVLSFALFGVLSLLSAFSIVKDWDGLAGSYFFTINDLALALRILNGTFLITWICSFCLTNGFS